MAGASTNIVPWRESSNAKLGMKEGGRRRTRRGANRSLPAPGRAMACTVAARAARRSGHPDVPDRGRVQGASGARRADAPERLQRVERQHRRARSRVARPDDVYLASLIVSTANGEYRQSRRLANPGARRAIAGASGKDRSTRSKTSHSTTAASHASSSDP
jgi:hypothetical protein